MDPALEEVLKRQANLRTLMLLSADGRVVAYASTEPHVDDDRVLAALAAQAAAEYAEAANRLAPGAAPSFLLVDGASGRAALQPHGAAWLLLAHGPGELPVSRLRDGLAAAATSVAAQVSGAER